MGKATDRRKANQQKYLQGLAGKDAHKFTQEWDKRLLSRAQLIHDSADMLRDHRDKKVPAAFTIVDEALQMLRSFGRETYKQHKRSTFDFLSNEYGKALGFSAAAPKLWDKLRSASLATFA